MRTLTLSIPDELYHVFEHIAARDGSTVEAVALDWLARNGPKPRPHLTEAESQAAWDRLLRTMGTVATGDPRSADNDRIDADVARGLASRSGAPTADADMDCT